MLRCNMCLNKKSWHNGNNPRDFFNGGENSSTSYSLMQTVTIGKKRFEADFANLFIRSDEMHLHRSDLPVFQ